MILPCVAELLVRWSGKVMHQLVAMFIRYLMIHLVRCSYLVYLDFLPTRDKIQEIYLRLLGLVHILFVGLLCLAFETFNTCGLQWILLFFLFSIQLGMVVADFWLWCCINFNSLTSIQTPTNYPVPRLSLFLCGQPRPLMCWGLNFAMQTDLRMLVGV